MNDREIASAPKCDGQNVHRKIIKNTGKIAIRGNCKLTTSDMTIQTKETVYETDIETYLPEIKSHIKINVN